MWWPLPKGPLTLFRSCFGSPGMEMVKFSSVDLNFGHSACLNPTAKSISENTAASFNILIVTEDSTSDSVGITPGITRRLKPLQEDEILRVGGRVHAVVRLVAFL